MVALGFSIAQALLVVPLLLSKWGAELYGVWVLIAASIAIAFIADTGHCAYVGNQLLRLWQLNRSEVSINLSSAVRAALVLSGIQVPFAVGLLFYQFGEAQSALQLDSRAWWAAVVLIIGWFTNVTISGLLHRIYPAAGEYTRSVWLGVLSRGLSFLGLALAVLSGADLPGAALAQAGAQTACNWYILYDLRRRFPETRPWLAGGSLRIGLINFLHSLGVSLSLFLDQIAQNGLLVLTGVLLDATQTAAISAARTMVNIAAQGAAVILSAVSSDLARFEANREFQKIGASIAVAWFGGCSVIYSGILIFACAYEPIFNIWTRGKLTITSEIFFGFALAVCVRQWLAPIAVYASVTNLVRMQVVTSLIRSAIALASAVLLIPIFGTAGGAGSVLIAEGSVLITVLLGWRRIGNLKHCLQEYQKNLRLSSIQLATVGLGLLVMSQVSELVVRLCVALISTALVNYIAVMQWRALPVSISNYIQASVKTRLLL